MGVSGRILQKWPTGKYMVSAHTGNSFRNSLESHKGGGKHKTTPKHSPRYAYAKLFLATIAALDPSITFHVIMKIKKQLYRNK